MIGGVEDERDGSRRSGGNQIAIRMSSSTMTGPCHIVVSCRAGRERRCIDVSERASGRGSNCVTRHHGLGLDERGRLRVTTADPTGASTERVKANSHNQGWQTTGHNHGEQ